MFYGASVPNAIFNHARLAALAGEEKNNPYREKTTEYWAYEDGWRITEDQHLTIASWLDVCQKVSEQAKGQALIFTSAFSDSRQFDGDCVFEKAIVDGEEYDGISLPQYQVKCDDQVIEVYGDELKAAGESSAKFDLMMDVISGGYGLSRKFGYDDPVNLVMDGTDEHRKEFKDHLFYAKEALDRLITA